MAEWKEANALQYAYATFALSVASNPFSLDTLCLRVSRSFSCERVCICVWVLVRIVSWYALGLNNRSRPLACRVINLLCSIHEHKSTFSDCVLLLLFWCSSFTMCLFLPEIFRNRYHYRCYFDSYHFPFNCTTLNSNVNEWIDSLHDFFEFSLSIDVAAIKDDRFIYFCHLFVRWKFLNAISSQYVFHGIFSS